MQFSTKILKRLKRDYLGMLYVLPVILGILLFTVVPMVTSLYYSLHDFKMHVGRAENFGFQNYITPFTTERKHFFSSLGLTFSYAIYSVPLGMVLSFVLAMFLNQKLRGMNVFRTLYYLPVIIPAVAGGLLWKDMTNVETGYFNLLLTSVGLPAQSFYSTAETVMPTLVFMSLFGLGGGMVLWIAQLKAIPETMYEAARIEGAGFFTRTFKITIPMCTPIIFYTLVLNVIGVLQTFAGVYLLRTGANNEALNFLVVYIYDTAFGGFNMGLACAMSWILFLIIAVLTACIFKTSKWVFYGEAT